MPGFLTDYGLNEQLRDWILILETVQAINVGSVSLGCPNRCSRVICRHIYGYRGILYVVVIRAEKIHSEGIGSSVVSEKVSQNQIPPKRARVRSG